MIDRVQILNFQRHGELKIVFDEKITTIVGPSDAGKSSVLRAIRWVAFNRPLGDGFIRFGEDECVVRLWVDGRKIERKKTKTSNVYAIDGKKLKAVGTEVPEEVQRILNLTPENFQSQHDPLFWFSLTAGEVGRRLNTIVDLDVIDRSATWIASRYRKAKTELEVAEERHSRSKADCEALSYFPELSADFDRLLVQEKTVFSAKKQWQSLDEYVEGAVQSSRTAVKLREAVVCGIELREAGDVVQGLSARCKGLGDAIEKARQSAERAGTVVPDLSGLDDGYNAVTELQGRIDRLTEAVKQAKKSKQIAQAMKKDAENAEAEAKKKIGNVCPLCGNKMGAKG